MNKESESTIILTLSLTRRESQKLYDVAVIRYMYVGGMDCRVYYIHACICVMDMWCGYASFEICTFMNTSITCTTCTLISMCVFIIPPPLPLRWFTLLYYRRRCWWLLQWYSPKRLIFHYIHVRGRSESSDCLLRHNVHLKMLTYYYQAKCFVFNLWVALESPPQTQ